MSQTKPKLIIKVLQKTIKLFPDKTAIGLLAELNQLPMLS